MPPTLVMNTPMGDVSLDTEPMTDFLMGLETLRNTLPHIDKADADAKAWIDGELIETKVQEVHYIPLQGLSVFLRDNYIIPTIFGRFSNELVI